MDISGGGGAGVNSGAFTLPAALLAQYPALQGLQWDQLGAPGPGDEAELSGRGSFDAGSGGDYFDDDDGSGTGSGYVSAAGTGFAGQGQGHGQGQGQGMGWGSGDWASDYEGR